MGTVTQFDFRAARPARPEPAVQARPEDFAWADRFATWWYSPAGRIVASAAVLAIVMTGLALVVVAAAGLTGALR